MSRLRLFAGLLGCLAVLAAALPAIAIAAAPVQTATDEPCQHCPECDAGPCAPAAVSCLQACVATPPTLGVETLDLPSLYTRKTSWPARAARLHGQSPPPDPFPPRS
ncbi:MAG: hypothetical protein ACT4O6_08610 [Reyranella sp.]